jgi:hypothetical protein
LRSSVCRKLENQEAIVGITKKGFDHPTTINKSRAIRRVSTLPIDNQATFDGAPLRTALSEVIVFGHNCKAVVSSKVPDFDSSPQVKADQIHVLAAWENSGELRAIAQILIKE